MISTDRRHSALNRQGSIRRTRALETWYDLFASTDAWTLMARSAGAGKVRHIRRPGPMRTVTIKLTIEGLVGQPICRPSSDVARCAD